MAALFILVFGFVMIVSPLFRCAISHFFNVLFHLIYDFIDYIKNKKWKIFKGYGLNIYVGYFGKGKSLSAVRYVKGVKKRYPHVNVYSNIKLTFCDYVPLTNYQQIIDAPADSIFLVDEISTVFNAREWKDFNVNLVYMLLQNRKQRKQIIGTAQRFKHVDKVIRDITNKVYDCNKVWRFQLITVYDGWDYENCDNPKLVKSLSRKCWYVFNSCYSDYDTSEMIDNSKRCDFKSNQEILESRGVVSSGTDLAGVRHLKRRGKKILNS